MFSLKCVHKCSWHQGTLGQQSMINLVGNSSRERNSTWDLAQPVYMFFWIQGRAYDRVSQGLLWRALWAYGADGPCYGPFNIQKSDPCEVSLWPHQDCPLSLDFFIIFIDRIFRYNQEAKGVRIRGKQTLNMNIICVETMKYDYANPFCCDSWYLALLIFMLSYLNCKEWEERWDSQKEIFV